MNYDIFNPNLLECGGDMRPQRKKMIIVTTHAFVKLKQIRAAVSAGGIIFWHAQLVERLLVQACATRTESIRRYAGKPVLAFGALDQLLAWPIIKSMIK